MSLSRRSLIGTALAATPVLGGASPRALAAPASPWALPAQGPVKMIENVFVPMKDGVRLAMQLWLPQGAAPAPVVLEYIPYRKRDQYRAYGLFWGQTLASYGVAYARLDVRGSGDSEGVLVDEYLPLEHEDAAEAIAYLAAQPWCNGAVGMRGVSWGGFSTLQTAALQPPALKAIMPISGSDIRYADDAHYIGGALGLTDLKWAASFKAVMAGPPDPAITGPGWDKLWRQRLDAAPPIAAIWLSHQRDDAYWRQGSIAEDYASIRVPVYVVGGLVDSYGNEIPRLLSKLTVPRKGLYGPWQHGYPEPATPGPGLDWAYEEVRWWTQWLKGQETGIMDEPMFRAYMPDKTAAEVAPGPIPGRWVAERVWPSPSIQPLSLHLNAGGELSAVAGQAQTVSYRESAIVGLAKPEWVPFAPSELPQRQNEDDARSLTFTTAPLTSDLEMLGRVEAHIRVAADKPVAKLAVRLCEVTPDGASWLVSYGVLNLTHRDSDAHPTALAPGLGYDVVVPFAFTAHHFKPGSRIRISVSESLWPLVWPSPETPTLAIGLGVSKVDLPVRARPLVEASFPIPIAPVGEPPSPKEGPVFVREEAPGGAVRVTETWPLSTSVVADTGETSSSSGPNVVLSIQAGQPNTCKWEAVFNGAFKRGDWDCALASRVELTSTAQAFHIIERLEARRDGKIVFERDHAQTIPRDLM